MTIHRPQLAAARRGTAAIELAVVLPLLILLALGCADFGRIAFTSISVNNAAGAGAQYAASHRFTDYSRPAWEENVKDAVLQDLQGLPDFDANLLTIDVATVVESDGRIRVVVEVSYPFQMAVDWPGLPHDVLVRKRIQAYQYR